MTRVATTMRMTPALTALVIYLRPAERHAIVSHLLALGILVVEHQGASASIGVGRAVDADIAVIVSDDPPDLATIDAVVREVTPFVVTVCPQGPCEAPAPDGGPVAASIADRIQRAATLARAARGRRDAAPMERVFGDVVFDPAIPALQRGVLAVTLSRSERDLLARLTAAGGRPVTPAELDSSLGGGTRGAHTGLVKAVVLRLRRKVESIGGNPRLLRTVRGVGYVLVNQHG